MQVDVGNFEENGYVVVSGLFPDAEVLRLREHYMDLRRSGSYPGDFGGVDMTSDDPLRRYPRLIHMHRWDQISLDWMLDARLGACFRQLIGKEPLAVQTMLYFKPAGSRGQALHQDQYYLRVQPGTCIAAWMALDDCDEGKRLPAGRPRQSQAAAALPGRSRHHAEFHRCHGAAIRRYAAGTGADEGWRCAFFPGPVDPRQLSQPL